MSNKQKIFRSAVAPIAALLLILAGLIAFGPDLPRARIIDTWPAEVDDAPARRDWGWEPDYDADRVFEEYLVPSISRYYENKS